MPILTVGTGHQTDRGRAVCATVVMAAAIFAGLAVTIGLCEQPTAKEDRLAKMYIDLYLTAYRADDARESEHAKKLDKKLAALRQKLVGGGDGVFISFTRRFEQLKFWDRTPFLFHSSWPFRTAKSYEYLVLRFNKGIGDPEAIVGEAPRIAEILAWRGYKPARPHIRKTYDKTKRDGSISDILAASLIRLGDEEPVLDLVAIIEKHKKHPRTSQAIAARLGTLAYDARIMRLCAGPVIGAYRSKVLTDEERGPLASGLAGAFGLDFNWNWKAGYLEKDAAKVVDAWLKTKAGRRAHWWSYLKLGRLAWKHKQYERAIGHYDSALSVRPKDVNAPLEKARCLGLLGKIDDGMVICRRLVKDHPRLHPAWFTIGILHFGNGQFPEAAKAYEKALSIEPNDWPTLAALRFVYIRLGEHDKAKAIKKRLKKLTTKPATTRSAKPDK